MAAGEGRRGAVGGFALAEVLAAAGILAVGLLGLGSMLVAAARAAEGARARRVAVALVRNALEAGPDGAGTAGFDREGRPARPGGEHFTVTVTRLRAPGPAAGYRVEATWPGPGRARRLAVSRLAAP
jgi:hypothetical protein